MNSVQEKLQVAIQQHQAGMLGEAEDIYRSVVRIDPAQADAWHLLGVVEHQKGHQQEAEDCITRAIEIAPNSAAFYSNLASVYKASDRLDAAKDSLEKAVSLDSNFVDAYYNLGTICKQLKHYPEAIQALETALSKNPTNAEAYHNLGTVYVAMKDHGNAIANFEKAIVRKPDFAEAINNLGLVYADQKNAGDAKKCFEDAHRCRADYVDPLLNLANLLRKEGETSKAVAIYGKAREIAPENISVRHNLAVALKDQGKYDGALVLFDEVIAEDPSHIQARYNRSFVHRLKGDLQNGWRNLDWQHPADENSRTFDGPRWDGSSLAEKTILFHAEQGIGDQIMFASCVGEIESEAKRVLLECDPRLVPIFRRSFPHAEIIAESEENRSLSYDVQSPLGGLLPHRRPNWESFPETNRFLKPDEGSMQKWRKRFEALSGKLIVGISWRGGLDPEVARQRSTDLKNWKPLFEIPEISFVNLQYGTNQEELDRIEKEHHMTFHDWEDSDPVQNLDDFAAKVAALDLVISVDNSTVHFAGGLETPCWILLPYVPDWRWFLNREDSPWYRTVKLFRQQTAGDWPEVFENVRTALLEKLQNSPDQPHPESENRTENNRTLSLEEREWLDQNASLRWHPSMTTLEESRRAFLERRYRFALEFCRGKTVLDAGCGTGYGTVILAKVADHVTGIDFCEKAAEFAQRNHGSASRTFRTSPLEHTPFEDSTFDVIVCFECLEHLISPCAGLREIARLLKDDGTAIVSVPNNWGLTEHHFCDPNFEYLKTTTEEFFEETEFFYNNSGTVPTCFPEGIAELNTIGPERAECLICVCRKPKKTEAADSVNMLLEEIYENAFARHREFLDARKSSYGTFPEIDWQAHHTSVHVGTEIELQSDSSLGTVSQVVLRFPLNGKAGSDDGFKVELPKIDLKKPVLGQLHLVMENGEIGQSPVIKLVPQ